MDSNFSYMLAFSNLILKLNKGEDCSAECEEIKTLSESDKETIVSQLMAMIEKNNTVNSEQIISALKKIDYLDPIYVDDYVSVIEMKQGTKQLEQMRQIVQEILSRQGYTQTVFEYAFWKYLTLIAVNLQDNDLLERFIRKLEEVSQ